MDDSDKNSEFDSELDENESQDGEDILRQENEELTQGNYILC